MRWMMALALAVASTAGFGKGFVVLPTEVQSREYLELARDIDQSGLLRDIAAELNSVLKLDRSLGLRFAECGEANAYYDAEAREVSVCFELIEWYYEHMAEAYDSEEELDDAVAGAFVFVFFHEIGHALVDVLDLPITGREEDAVDQLSAWILLDGAEGDQAVLDAALSFYAASESADMVDEGAFADEHSLDQQRFYNMVCWVYGSDPEGYEHLLEDDYLPAARAERCESEYAQIDRSWTRLLKAHVRP